MILIVEVHPFNESSTSRIASIAWEEVQQSLNLVPLGINNNYGPLQNPNRQIDFAVVRWMRFGDIRSSWRRRQRPCEQHATTAGYQVLAGVEFVGDGRTGNMRPGSCVPKRFAVARIQCEKVAMTVAGEGKS
jgi:hypothetical protein